MSSSLLVDRVKILILSSGVGPFALGPGVTGFRGTEALIDGATYSYAVENGGQYEAGTGTYVALGPQFLRFPEISSNGGGAVAFPANCQLVFTARAADLVATGGTFPIVNALGNNPAVAIAQKVATEQLLLRPTASDLAGNSAAGGIGTLSGQSVQYELNARVPWVPSRAVLAAQPVDQFADVFLNEGGRSGIFQILAGSAPADPQQGLYVPSTTPGFYWARLWDNVNAQVEWFGAVPSSSGAAAANATAINACIALCPVTNLQSADYWTADTIKVLVGYRTVRGAVTSTGYGSSGTRVLSTNGAKSVFQFGPDTMPGGGVNAFLRGISAENLCARWDATMVIPSPGSESTAAKAFDYRFMIGAMFSNLSAHEPFIGHYLYGTVACKWLDCGAFRSVNYGVNDFYRGFWLQGNPAVLAGGNASAYIVRPNVSAAGSAVTANIAYYCNASFADTYLIWPECAGMTQAAVFDGGGSSAANGMLDTHIINPIFDQCGGIGIDFVNFNELATVTVSGGYIQMRAGADKAIWARSGGGSVVLTGGLQLIGSDGGSAALTSGIRASNQPQLIVDASVTIKEFGNAAGIDGGCTSFLFEPTIYLTTHTGTNDAIYVNTVHCGRIAPRILARSGGAPYTVGINLTGGASDRVTVELSGIVPAAVGVKLKINGATITATGWYKPNGTAGAETDNGIEVTGFPA